MAATNNTHPLAAEFKLQDSECTAQVDGFLTRYDVRDTPLTQIVKVFARSLLTDDADAVGRVVLRPAQRAAGVHHCLPPLRVVALVELLPANGC